MRSHLMLAAIGALLFAPLSASAQEHEWKEFMSKEDGFSANYVGDPKIEPFEWKSEFFQTYPARRYTSTEGSTRYSTTVVDYRTAEAKHRDRRAKCEAAKGANGLDGDSCQYDFGVEIAGAINYGVWNVMNKPGATVTHFNWCFTENVGGTCMQLTHADKSRTFAAIHMHAGRLYIHEATVAANTPEPILFLQGLGFVDEEGRSIRYRGFYTEAYGEWRFPHPIPPRVVRGDDGKAIPQGTALLPPSPDGKGER